HARAAALRAEIRGGSRIGRNFGMDPDDCLEAFRQSAFRFGCGRTLTGEQQQQCRDDRAGGTQPEILSTGTPASPPGFYLQRPRLSAISLSTASGEPPQQYRDRADDSAAKDRHAKY